MQRTLQGLFTFVAVAGFVTAPALEAQGQRAPEVFRNADGEVFDFHPDGAWRVLARRVAAHRRLLMAQGNYQALNAAMAAPSTEPSPAVVSGVRRVPAVLYRFNDNGTAPNLPAGAGDTSKYNQLIFSANAPTGMGYSTPYSIRSFYSQMSNGLLDLQGEVIGWYTLANAETNYTGGQACAGQNPYGNSNCNGIWNSTATAAMRGGLTEALTQADATTNFALYDNDGADGNANSGDDDGFVDMTLFVHSEQDGACLSASNGHQWSHRSQMPFNGGNFFQTNDARTGGGFVRVRDYTLQSGLGGASGCTPTQIMSIGTAGHESGHAFGLPDLYDTQQATEGIGSWGLMGSGNQATGASPARMEAWSLNELGWVTVVPLTVNGTYTFGPAPTGDTTFLIRPSNPNTRKEYYLLENRQAAQSDTALIRTVCTRSGLVFPATCHGGLAIWHVDSAKIQASKSVNQMNAGTGFHGLALVQADNRLDLEKSPGSGNRGDAGDLWPGFGTGTPKTRYSFDTSPAATKNVDTSFVGFEITNITQSALDGEMSFQLAFGGLTVVRSLDTLAKIRVDGALYGRFAGLFTNGSTHSISMDSPQTAADGRSQFVWVSWSDGGGRTHDVTGNFAGDSISATVSSKYKIQATVQGTGSVTSLPTVDHANGAFVDKNSAMTLTATAGGGSVFERWIGDVNTTTNPLVLNMSQPYNVVATFSGALAQTSGSPPDATMGKSYIFNLTASGGTGSYSWTLIGGALPTGMTLATSGAIAGVPQASGAFSANVRVTSGAQTADGTVNLTVVEPTLALANTLGGLLGTGGTLSNDDKTYLDLIGNKNNIYDVGDFLAWVEKTDAQPMSSPYTATFPKDPFEEPPSPEEPR